MPQRSAILQLAKMVAQDMARGQPSRGAFDSGPALAQAGAVADLIAGLVREAMKPRLAERLLGAFCFLLEGALSHLRIAANGGDSSARRSLAEACRAVDMAVTVNSFPSAVLMMIARSFVQAGLEPGPGLKNAMMAGMEARLPENVTPFPRVDLARQLAPLAEALGQDPFIIHAELSATGAAFPSEHRAAMAAELAASEIPALRDASLGFLLDADPALGVSVLEALTSQAHQHPIPSRLIERLVTLRPWLSASRKPKLDAAIRVLRAQAAAPTPAPRVDVEKVLASLCDGAGAQSVFVLLKTGRRFALASLLFKADVGIADAWVREGITKREANDIILQITEATEAVTVPIEFARTRLRDALSIHNASDMPPPLCSAASGRGPWLKPPPARSDAASSTCGRFAQGPAARPNRPRCHARCTRGRSKLA